MQRAPFFVLLLVGLLAASGAAAPSQMMLLPARINFSAAWSMFRDNRSQEPRSRSTTLRAAPSPGRCRLSQTARQLRTARRGGALFQAGNLAALSVVTAGENYFEVNLSSNPWRPDARTLSSRPSSIRRTPDPRKLASASWQALSSMLREILSPTSRSTPGIGTLATARRRTKRASSTSRS